MSETSPYRESTTGLRNTPCLVFGNGVEIELKPYAKTTQESTRQSSDGKTIHVLPQRLGKDVPGINIVKVHFLPHTSQSERANDPTQVSENEKKKIALDAIEGFLLLASALQTGINIEGISAEEDFYLYAETNPQFATFLKKRCGFRGTEGGSEVWIKRSEFTSVSNIEHIQLQKQQILSV